MTAKAFVKAKAFIDQVHDLYLAQKKRGTIASGVYRGTSPSIAADAENLFGRYIKNEFLSGSGYEIWVDPQISCPPNTEKKKRWIYKPDICVVRDNTVIGVFELKMDLGYLKKTFTAHAGERAALLRKASKAEVHCNIGGKRRDIRFAQNLRPNFVVFCRSNISQKQMETIEEYFKAKKSPGPLFILTKGDHLNDKNADYKADEKAFEYLQETIERLSNPSGFPGARKSNRRTI